MDIDFSRLSIARWYPDKEQRRCGYCKDNNGSISHGMFTQQLTVQDYKDMIDRGWRRSGLYCYKPKMDETCCPQYTIRCDGVNFVLNKSHKKVIKKLNKYLNDGVLNKNVVTTTEEELDIEFPGSSRLSSIGLVSIFGSGAKTQQTTGTITIKDKMECGNSITSSQNSIKIGMGADPAKPKCKKAKLMRLERKQEKLIQKGLEIQSNLKQNSQQKTLDEFLDESCSSTKHKLSIKLISTSKKTHQWEESKDVEYQLFTKYQKIVHGDKSNSMDSFLNFLVNSPLIDEPFPEGIDGPGYGSFHQQYWIDDKLIAVGVIDILPGCVSSVYFFYDPDYRDLTLGTYGSLREVQLVRDLQSQIPDLRYYYLGFYIHSCPKMRYKGKLNPSDLVCPETYLWFPISRCLPILDASKYSRLNDDGSAVDVNQCDANDVDSIKVFYKEPMYVKDLVLKRPRIKRMEFEKLGKLIGKQLSKRMLIFIEN